MRSSRSALLALIGLGGYLVWRNRFAIQRQLESLGIKTPILGSQNFNLGEAAKSAVSKVAGKFEHGANVAESSLQNESKASGY